jgi:CcmD family protein
MTTTNATPEAPAPGHPEDRATEFVAVQGGAEGTSAETLLVAAYLVMWAALIGFLVLTWRRQSRIEARIDALDVSLRRAAEKA